MHCLVKVSLYNTDTGENAINHLPGTKPNLDYLRNTNGQIERTQTTLSGPNVINGVTD